MAKKFMRKDAWISEAEESVRIVEDLEARIRDRSLEEKLRIRVFGGSKLLELGVKLDRLESLLHNPPSNPILTDEELDFRWKMLSDVLLRTKALAVSLYTSPSPTGPEGSLAADAKEKNRITSISDNQGQIQASPSKTDGDLLNPLILNDEIQTQVQITEPGYSTLLKRLQCACWTICAIVGASALVFVLVILCAVI